METWINEAISKWNLAKTKQNHGASIADIENAENILNFKFPADFKNLYLVVNGFQDLDWQEHMFYFWPIDRIIEEYAVSSDEDFIGFCDFLLASHFIGFKKSQSGIFKLYSTMKKAEDSPIANTFQSAVGMINSSSDLIY